jgi:hypothetical protein
MQSGAYDNYDGFQHVNFKISQNNLISFDMGTFIVVHFTFIQCKAY